LIVNNCLRLAAVNTVGDMLTWLGKVCVTLLAGIMCFFLTDMDLYTDVDSETYLSSPLLPIILSMCIAYFIAEVFFQVYEMAIDTILLSFCEDCEQHDGNPQYAPELLMKAIGKSASNKIKPNTSGD
ncbi:hypothetical protein CYMTET_31912, partial [Cymbomonas tetramitiformis]